MTGRDGQEPGPCGDPALFLRAVLDNASDLMWAVDSREFRLVWYNEGLRLYYEGQGVTIREGMPQEELLPDETHRAFWQGLYEKALEEGSLRRDYRTFHGERSLDLALNRIEKEGRPVAISVIGRDVTEGKAAERELMASEEEFRRLFESMFSACALFEVVHDRAGGPKSYRFLKANPAFETMTGLHRADIAGKTPEESGISLTRKALPEYFRIAEEGGVFQSELFNESLGRYFDVRTFSPRKGEFAILFNDITERKRAESELARHQEELERLVAERTRELAGARDAAEAASRAKSAFLANMSHEIRTPMNAVLGFAQLLERDPGLSPAARDKVATILRSGDHLLDIINEVLEMSRIEAGHVELHLAPFDLHELLRDVVAMFRLKAGGKGIELALELAPGLPRIVESDMAKVRQVAINLVGNALKFTEHGSVRVSAGFTEACGALGEGEVKDEAVLELVVSDSGAGIPAEKLLRLFKPFERATKEGESVQGTGLGLALSRQYARLLGGDVELTSEEGKGSRAVFRFRARARTCPGESPGEVGSGRRKVLRLAEGEGPVLALVVDDQASNRAFLRETLEDLCFEVEEAKSGEEAVELAVSRPYDLVLMDIMMPGLDGLEATRAIRRSKGSEELPVIGVSAGILGLDGTEIREAGLDACIGKPFREEELVALVTSRTGLRFAYTDKACGKVETRTGGAASLDGESGGGTPDRVEAGGLTARARPPDTWLTEVSESLARGSVTRLRHLAEEADAFDPALAADLAAALRSYRLEPVREMMDRLLGEWREGRT